MNNADKLQTLREIGRWYDGPVGKEAIDYAIQCVEAVQSRRTLTPSEITEPGLYLAKTADGEVIALRVHADQINLGTVFLGFTFQGPFVWAEDE